MRLRFETLSDASREMEGPIREQLFEIEIKADATIEDKRRECERFLRHVEKLMKE